MNSHPLWQSLACKGNRATARPEETRRRYRRPGVARMVRRLQDKSLRDRNGRIKQGALLPAVDDRAPRPDLLADAASERDQQITKERRSRETLSMRETLT